MPLSALVSQLLHKPIWLKTIIFVGLVIALYIAWPLAVAGLYGLVVWHTMRQPKTRYALVAAMVIPALIMQFTWARSVIGGFTQPTTQTSQSVAQATPTPTPTTNQVQGATTQTQQSVKVLQAVSGDTLDVDYNGQPYRVNLIGLKAPSMTATTTGKAECFGPESQMFLDSLLRGRSVKLLSDNSISDTGQSEVARYVTMDDGTQVNRLMLEAGLARPDIEADYEVIAEYKAYAEAAKAAKKGLWLNCDKPAAAPTPSPTPASPTPTPTPRPTITTTITPINPEGF